MPVFYQHNINDGSRLAIWSIVEDEEFFLKKVSITSAISHPHKRLQHLAGRYLLQILYPGFPYEKIEFGETQKPFLRGDPCHFSISHCGDFAAAIVSETRRVGIDIELVKDKIEKIKHKFLNDKEIQLIEPTDNFLLTLFWSCKEAVFKWYGKGHLDFKKHILIQKIGKNSNNNFVHCLFVKDKQILLTINYKFFENLVLAWIDSQPDF